MGSWRHLQCHHCHQVDVDVDVDEEEEGQRVLIDV